MNKSPLTLVQEQTLKTVDAMYKRLEEPRRWFTQAELPGVKLLTLDPLVDKNYLKRKRAFGVVYYQTTKHRVGKSLKAHYVSIPDTESIVLEVDDITVTIEYPTDVSEYDAVCIAKETIDEERREQICPESESIN